MIEHLESRTFLSVSSDASAISEAASGVESSFLSLKSGAASKEKVLAADLKRIHASASANGILNTLKSRLTSELNTVEGRGKADFNAIAPNVKTVVKAVDKLEGKPTNTALQAAVRAAVSHLNASAKGKAASFAAAASAVDSTLQTELNLLLAQTTSDAKTQSDITAAEAVLENGATNIGTDGANFFADVTQLATDATAAI